MIVIPLVQAKSRVALMMNRHDYSFLEAGASGEFLISALQFLRNDVLGAV